jgi:hypothetical protein
MKLVLFCITLSLGSQGRIEEHTRSSSGEMRNLVLAINSKLAQMIVESQKFYSTKYIKMGDSKCVPELVK